jgi:hypothetical protein
MVILRKGEKRMENNQIAWLQGAAKEQRSLAAEVATLRRRLVVTRWMLATALLVLAALVLQMWG